MTNSHVTPTVSKSQDCSKCPKYKTCSKLCDEAELYVSQDYVPQRELTIGLPRYQDHEWPDLAEKIPMTKREKEICTLIGRGINRGDICKLLDIKRDTLRSHIRNLRNKAQNMHDFN